MKRINLDVILKDQTIKDSLLLKIYRFNREINREIINHLQKADLEDL